MRIQLDIFVVAFTCNLFDKRAEARREIANRRQLILEIFHRGSSAVISATTFSLIGILLEMYDTLTLRVIGHTWSAEIYNFEF